MSVNSLVTRELIILESGDRISRAEFERCYRAMPRLKMAELIRWSGLRGIPCEH